MSNNSQKTPKIIQLVTAPERFREFNKILDKTLSNLDILSDMYIDMGFRESDIEDLNEKEALAFMDELKSHSQMVMSLIHHPLIQILNEKRNTVESNDLFTSQLGYPEGDWQHYKGSIYTIVEQARSTDTRLDGVTYRLKDAPKSRLYFITLVNFYKKVNIMGRQTQRFTKL